MILRRSVIISVFLLAALIFFGSVMAGENPVEEARQAFHRGDYEQAEELWKEVSELEGYEWETGFYLGLIYLRLEDYELAAEEMDRAFELRPEDYATAVNYARILYNKEEIERAGEVLDRIPEDRRRSDEQYYNIRGLLAMSEGELERAFEAFASSVNIEPDNIHVRNNFGLALMRQNRYEEAIEHLEYAADMEPEIAYIYNNLGVSYENLDRLKEARDSYERALEIDPDHPRAGANLERVEALLEDQ